VSLVGKARLAQRTPRTELACARALLDALEAVLDAEHEEQTRCDVAAQVADQLARVANTLKQWKSERPAEESLSLDGAFELSSAGSGAESEGNKQQVGDATGPRERTERGREQTQAAL
jgi:hypothetical protein